MGGNGFNIEYLEAVQEEAERKLLDCQQRLLGADNINVGNIRGLAGKSHLSKLDRTVDIAKNLVFHWHNGKNPFYHPKSINKKKKN